MSATANLEAVANQGQFHCRIPPSQPFTTKGVRSLQLFLPNFIPHRPTITNTGHSTHQASKSAKMPSPNSIHKNYHQAQRLKTGPSTRTPSTRSPRKPTTWMYQTKRGHLQKTPFTRQPVPTCICLTDTFTPANLPVNSTVMETHGV
jgi:hypothetical protein